MAKDVSYERLMELLALRGRWVGRVCHHGIRPCPDEKEDKFCVAESEEDCKQWVHAHA